jgi:two-component system OmpR family sensor kinase
LSWLRRAWPALLAGLPLLVGLAVALGLQGGLTANPVLRIQARADVGTLALLGGAVATLVLLAALVARQAAERRLRRALSAIHQEAAEARRRFVHRLDHELKNPLTALRAQLAYLSSDPSEAGAHTLDDMAAQVERLRRLLTELRKLADLETRAIERLPVDLGQLLTEVVDAARDLPGRKARQVRLLLPQAPWPLPAAAGDRDLLWLTFYNLLDNALKFSQDEAVVEVRAFEDGRWLVAEVADTGPGIPDEDRPHIFEELYRGTNARGCDGSGLGLALVQTIVARHGGSVAVRSRPGQGTLFAVRLPLA